MPGKWRVALDQGTSSCRASAVDEQGVVHVQKSTVFSPRRTPQGFSEYQAEELLQAQLTVLNGLLDEIGPEQVAALAICSQRSTVVLWDQTTGRSLAPVLTWEDGRALLQAQQAPLSQEEVHASTGLFKTPFFSAPKIAWCLANFPQARAAAQAGTLRVGPVASYLIWHLTGGKTFATDPTLAQRTLLWDIRSGNWSKKLCAAFGVPVDSLPALLPTVADYGTYAYQASHIPICVCAADQQAAVAYHQLTEGQSTINYGTGAFWLQSTGRELKILPGMLSSVAARVAQQEQEFLLEGPVFAAGSALQWLQMQGFNFSIDQLDALCETSTRPVLFLPALGGLGAPYWDYQVSSRVENLSPQTRLCDWTAGTLQAIAGLVADIGYYLQANAVPPAQTIRVSGGLSRSAYLLQYQADLLQRTLEVCEDTESTILGAALLASYHLNGAFAHWQQPAKRTFKPQRTAQQAHLLYNKWQQFVADCRYKKM